MRKTVKEAIAMLREADDKIGEALLKISSIKSDALPKLAAEHAIESQGQLDDAIAHLKDISKFQSQPAKSAKSAKSTLSLTAPKKRTGIYYEDGVKKESYVSRRRFGEHYYPGCHDSAGFYTSNCKFGCGCWMGSFRSGGPVDPFGPCPKNPKIKRKRNE